MGTTIGQLKDALNLLFNYGCIDDVEYNRIEESIKDVEVKEEWGQNLSFVE